MMERLDIDIVEHVWNRGQPTFSLGSDPDTWRKDRCGAWIKKGEFGRRSQFGWEIDEALIPVHWQNIEPVTGRACDVTASHSSVRENTVAD